jgi:hypothetical protein
MSRGAATARPGSECVVQRKAAGARAAGWLLGVLPFALCVALGGAPSSALSQASGLVAAYSFDAGTGTTLADVSGNGHQGTLTNSPAWSGGKYRSGLQFVPFDDGNDDNDPRVVLGRNVNIPNPPFTVSAWINPADFGDWRAIISKRDGVLVSEARFDIGLTPGSGQVYVYTGNAVYFSYAPRVGEWTHPALVADSSSTRLYVNGVLQETSAALALGSNTSANAAIGGSGEGAGGDNDPFSGRIDDLRIYSRALTQAEIQADMETPLPSGGTGGDTVSPSAPSGLTASAASGTQVGLSWNAASDNVGVTGYRIERCEGAACTNFVQVAATGGTAFNDTGRIASTGYRYRVVALDAAGNLSEYSNLASATTPSVPAGTGLVAAYNFDSGVGTTLPDVSGNGHHGTLLNNPVWTTGQHGSALQFNALDDSNEDNDPRVALGRTADVPDPPFTISAWINPGGYADWRSIISKRDGLLPSDVRLELGLASGSGQIYVCNGFFIYLSYAPPVGTWTHIALVADSSGMRLYVNGVLHESRGLYRLGPNTNAITGIGGLGETAGGDNDPFDGKVDDLRIYNRALSEAEIAADLATPAGGVPPTISDATPAPNAVLAADAAPIIGASLQPGSSSINAASVQLIVDGVNVTAAATVTAGQVTYQRSEPFTEGTHSVQLSVADVAGLSASQSWSFTTRSAPEAVAVTPDNVTTTHKRPPLRVVYRDVGAGIDVSQVRLVFNGVDVSSQTTFDASALTFTPAVDLVDGQHTATIMLGDLASNVSSRTWSFRVRSLPVPQPTSGDRATRPLPSLPILQ